MQRYASSAASVLVGAAFAGVAFGAKGGSDLGSLTWVEIALIVVGALIVAVAVMHGRRDQIDGGSALLAFVALAVLTTLSLLWSIAPDLSWIEANRQQRDDHGQEKQPELAGGALTDAERDEVLGERVAVQCPDDDRHGAHDRHAEHREAADP